MKINNLKGEQMKIEEVYNWFDHNWALAMRETGLSKNTYQLWLKKGYIPMHTQLRIEEATNKKLLADVSQENQLKRKSA